MIYVTGDLHGDLSRLETFRLHRLKRDDKLIICGDFGFLWDNSDSEKKALDKLSKKKYTILFVDGTHENFDLLEQYPVEEWNGGKVHRIRENILHLMRGQIFTIEGKSIFTFGGGESPEKQMRIEAGCWWEREMPDIHEMDEGVENLYQHDLTVDYIITHSPYPGAGRRFEDPRERTPLETYFEEVAKKVKYQKWYFGSLHVDRNYTSRHTAVFEAILPIDVDGRKGRKK